MSHTSRIHLSLLSATVAAALLAACGQPNNETVGQSVGKSIDQSVADAKSASAKASDDLKAAGQELKDAAKQEMDKLSAHAADALISTKISAALAVDDKLKATKIDVDTRQGGVALIGTAPDEDSKNRATTLARAVEGVKSVDNRLTVSPKG